jgi:hypothetical protein
LRVGREQEFFFQGEQLAVELEDLLLEVLDLIIQRLRRIRLIGGQDRV